MFDRKAKQEEDISRLSSAEPQDPAAEQGVIVLHDLTGAPESDVSRLKSRVRELTAEIGSLRSENESLKAELREIKLVLSKVQIDELRGFEKVNSWLQSLKMVL